MKKRILIISLAWFPFESGAESAPRNIAEHLADEYTFDVITYRFKKEWSAQEVFSTSYPHTEGNPLGNASIYRVGGVNKYDWMLRAFFKAMALHRSQPYDFIWSIMAAYAGGVAYWFKVFHSRVPLLLTLQEGDPIEHIMRRVGITRPWFRDLFRRADAVQAISRYLANLAKELGFKGEPVVIPNGVDIEKFSLRPLGNLNTGSLASSPELEARLPKTPDPSTPYALRPTPSLSFPKNGKQVVLINTSRLVHKNAHDMVIQALKFLPEHVVYKNVAQQGDLQEELLTLAQQEGVARRVFLMPGLPLEKIPEWLQQGDIFVRPSRSEGLGSSFLEAMAAGLPIIATPVGGIPDFLTDGETGLFAKVNDPKSVADCVSRLIDDTTLRIAITANAHQQAMRKYSWDSVVRQIRPLFATLGK